MENQDEMADNAHMEISNHEVLHDIPENSEMEQDLTAEQSGEQNISTEPSSEKKMNEEPSSEQYLNTEPSVEDNQNAEPYTEQNPNEGPSSEQHISAEPSSEEKLNEEPPSEQYLNGEPNIEDNQNIEPSSEQNPNEEPFSEQNISTEPSSETKLNEEPPSEQYLNGEPNIEDNQNEKPSPEQYLNAEPNIEDNQTVEPSSEQYLNGEPNIEDSQNVEPSSEQTPNAELFSEQNLNMDSSGAEIDVVARENMNTDEQNLNAPQSDEQVNTIGNSDEVPVEQTQKVLKNPKISSFRELYDDYGDDYDEPWPGNAALGSYNDVNIRKQSLKPDGNGNSKEKHDDETDDLGIYDDTAVCDDLSDTEIGEGQMTQRDDVSEKELVVEKTEAPEINVLDENEKLTEPVENQELPPEGYDIPDDMDMPPHVSWVPYRKHLTTKNGQTRLYSDGSLYGVRGKANTPASLMTDYLGSQFSIDPAADTSRNASRVASESREAMFRRAMTLLSARCNSVVPGVETPYGATAKGQAAIGGQIPQYFYIKQQKPKPNIAPLKAWNGYHGNIYFEPIHITPASGSLADDFHEQGGSHFPKFERRKSTRPESNNTHTRTFSRATNKSSIKSGKTVSNRPVVLLDKRAVINRFNKNIQQELDWLESQESTGSLAVRPKSDPIKSSPTIIREQTVYNKEKICKGSMAHKLNIVSRHNNPTLKVSGDKFSQPTLTSPLLRTQTQYTLSNRLTTNSPDLFHPLPPLEQLRATVRHMDNVGNPATKNASYRQNRPITDELKPFIKYSPDIKPKRETSLA